MIRPPAYIVNDAFARRAMPGEAACGDQVVIVRQPGALLYGVVDGLGHGPGAAHAAAVACAEIERVAQEGVLAIASLEALMKELNRALRPTRGAAVTLLRLSTTSLELEHAGIGNVMVATTHPELVKAVPAAGVVGSGLRRVNVQRSQLKPGMRLAVYTDGISRRFDLSSYRDLHVQAAADAIITQWSRSSDDATCLIIQC